MFSTERQKAYEILSTLLAMYSPYFQEHQLSDYVYEYMTKLGANPIRQEVTETREFNYSCRNVMSIIHTDKPETVVINAHMDTVYVTEGWTYPPLKGTLVGDEVYGLGAADMKGGLTSLLLCLEECLDRIDAGQEPTCNIVFLASVDEEGPFSLGAKTFLRSSYGNDLDAVIVLESSKGLSRGNHSFPTIIHGSKGCYLFEIEVTGKSAHAAEPTAGANAINEICKIVEQIQQIPLEKHNLFDDPTSNVIWISGGERALSTPEKCRILVDFHVTPGETKEILKRKIVSHIDALTLQVDVKVNYMKDDLGEPMIYEPYLFDRNHPRIDSLAKVCQEQEGSVNYGLSICVGDFNHFAQRGIPTIVLGPDGENLHCGDEKVNLNDIVTLKNLLVDYVFKPIQ